MDLPASDLLCAMISYADHCIGRAPAGCPSLSFVREPDGWLYRGSVRRTQLRLRIEVLNQALERDRNGRAHILRGAGCDPFFKGLTPYEQRLVIQALELSRDEAQALFG